MLRVPLLGMWQYNYNYNNQCYKHILRLPNAFFIDACSGVKNGSSGGLVQKDKFFLFPLPLYPDLALAHFVLTLLSQDYGKSGTTLESRPLQLKVTVLVWWCLVPPVSAGCCTNILGQLVQSIRV